VHEWQEKLLALDSRARNDHFSCFFVGLCGQPEPVEEEPHQRHLFPPVPWRCFLVGLWGQPLPYEAEPQYSHFFSSPECSCFFVGL
jgi:hypothetical protein